MGRHEEGAERRTTAASNAPAGIQKGMSLKHLSIKQRVMKDKGR